MHVTVSRSSAADSKLRAASRIQQEIINKAYQLKYVSTLPSLPNTFCYVMRKTLTAYSSGSVKSCCQLLFFHRLAI